MIDMEFLAAILFTLAIVMSAFKKNFQLATVLLVVFVVAMVLSQV